MKAVFATVLTTLGFISYPTMAIANGEAAKELIKAFGIETYTATRKDQDFYELQEGYMVKTKYCYVYTYYSKVVITKSKIIFVDDDQACDVDGVYRK